MFDADSGGEEAAADVGYLVATGREAHGFGGVWYRWHVRKDEKQLAKCRRPALRMQCSKKRRAGCTDDRRSVAGKCHFFGVSCVYAR